jgi:hypoxanthine-DNA glycosylase
MKPETRNLEPETSFCFRPIDPPHARILILGTLPGQASLAAGQYYAHPRNAFWPILETVLGIPRGAPYAERIDALRRHGIALWDVFHSAVRPGSLDGDIRDATPNDFPALFARCPGIRRVLGNGALAHRAYLRRVQPTLPAAFAGLPVLPLPSTSPAHAGMSLAEKTRAWAEALRGD